MNKLWDTVASHGINRRQFVLAACASAFGGGRLLAQQPLPVPGAFDDDDKEGLMGVLDNTAGGKQFWADVWFFHDWRIQRNALTNHYRLLDGANRRRAWGTLAACRAEMDSIRRRDRLPPMQGKAVVVLHGLFRSRSAMIPLCTALAKGGGYTTFNVGYPTTRGSVAEHAASLDSVILSLEGCTEINFVGHSLGNLVVRRWLGDLAAEQRGLRAGQQFGRMVMHGPPNHHPQIAAKLLGNDLATFFAGPAAEELASGWETLHPKLATPPFEFGIIAGGRGDDRGFNPLLSGDNDGVVTVESTRLAGARDFRLLPVLHSFVMNDAKAQELTLRFLQHGHFESDATRQPIAGA
jgi:hypothetical protein